METSDSTTKLPKLMGRIQFARKGIPRMAARIHGWSFDSSANKHLLGSQRLVFSPITCQRRQLSGIGYQRDQRPVSWL